MPNAIIAPALQAPSQASGVPGSSLPTGPVSLLLEDPRFARAPRLQFTREDIPELRLAGTFFLPSGRWPARGWFLVKRGDLDLLQNKFRTDLQLALDDFLGGAVTYKNLCLVQARNVTAGVLGDPNALYLVELTDARGILWNPWASFPTNTQYNVRAPAYAGGFYELSAPLALWSWDTLVGDLWDQMGAFLGPYPGLPVTPHGTPENYIFPGVSAWLALNQILELCGLTVAVDLTQDNPYTIVPLGAADADYDRIVALAQGRLEDDWDYIDLGSGRVPKQVTVYFHRRNQYYGTEETVRGDRFQWSSTPLYAVTVPAPPQFMQAAGTAFLWDDFTVQFDVDNNPLAGDVAAAADIAQDRATQYYNRIYRGTLGYQRRLYAGLLPFTPGAQVDGVRLFMDFRRGSLGWSTETVRGPDPPWPEVRVREMGS